MGHNLLILNTSRSHTMHHRQHNSSGRVISSSQTLLTTHNTHNRQTSVPTAVVWLVTSAGERPHTYVVCNLWNAYNPQSTYN